MDSKVFETILGSAVHNGHTYIVHQFVKWYGFLPNWMRDRKGGEWDDWYLVRKYTPCNHGCGTPRWKDPDIEKIRSESGEKDALFYQSDDDKGYIVYEDGIPTTDIPTVGYYNLPEGAELDEVNSWEDYRNGTYKRSFEDPVRIWSTEEYEKFFTPKFKVGDTVFCVLLHDRDTRCGERYQIHHMTIEKVSIDMGRIMYSNHDRTFFNIDNIDVYEWRVAATVEELVKRLANSCGILYMWNPDVPLGIIPCTSTEQYRKANI